MSQTAESANSGPRGRDDFWSVYWAVALDKWRDTERRISRNMTLMLAAAVLFGLVDRNLIEELDLSLFKLPGSTFILPIIPVVVSYLQFSIAALAADGDWIQRAYWESFHRHYAGNNPNHEVFYRVALMPSGGIFYAWLKMDYTAADRLTALASLGNYFKAAVAVIWPLVFEIYCGVRLFDRFGFGSALIWVAVVASALLLFFAFCALLSSPTSPPDEPSEAPATG